MSADQFQHDWFFGVRQYRHLLDAFYQQYCYEQRYVFVDRSRCSNLLQREWKVDTMVQKDAQCSLAIEEKIVKWPANNTPYTAFFLETRSCTNKDHESDGWMKTSQADLLFYAFEIQDVGLVAYLLDFPRLQHWFWHDYLPSLPHPGYGLSIMPGANRTEGRLVAIATVVKQIRSECFLLPFEGRCQKLPPEVTLVQVREQYLQRRNLEKKEPGAENEGAT